MNEWEELVGHDADDVLGLLTSQYEQKGVQPLSIARLATKLGRTRERVGAALTLLVLVRKSVGVAGSPERPSFFPASA